MSNYTDIMERGINNKRVLLQFVDWDMPVVDVGSSTGALTFELATVAASKGKEVTAIEPDWSAYKTLSRNVETFGNVNTDHVSLEDFVKSIDRPCNLVLSSVVHHMLQWNEYCGAFFDRNFSGLPGGSRVIIRDGCRPGRQRANEIIGLICTPYSLQLAKEFRLRFGEWHVKDTMKSFTIEGCTVWAERWLIIEMMLTITWGWESMERECREHYTVLGIEDYLGWFKEPEWETLYCESIIQDGYMEHLPKLGKLVNRNGWEIPLPFTNQILAFKKK